MPAGNGAAHVEAGRNEIKNEAAMISGGEAGEILMRAWRHSRPARAGSGQPGE